MRTKSHGLNPLEGKQGEYKQILNKWKRDFRQRMRTRSGSRKAVFTYEDAVSCMGYDDPALDTTMVSYLSFINGRPLAQNDYYKYVQSYINGKELNLKYFRHDPDKLKGYYTKADKGGGSYNPFNLNAYKSYVLFMMLKLNGVYKDDYDNYFNIERKDHREYSPISKIPSVLRGMLPFKVKEYDIKRAYPTFIDIELGINDRVKDFYADIDKKQFNRLLNIHSKTEGATLEGIREKLRPIYGDRVNEVVTDERFNEKGEMFRDMAVHEKKAIEDFIKANAITDYVRLHDGVFVKAETEAEMLELGAVKFGVKECAPPEIINDTINFYRYSPSGKLLTSPTMYKNFFEQERIIRARDEAKDQLIILKDTNNVVSPFNHKTETVGFLQDNINECDTAEIENQIAKDNRTIIPEAYLLVKSKPLKYRLDKKDGFGLPFKNGFFSFNGSNVGLECQPYDNVDGFFAPHKTQSHPFTETDEVSQFETFLTMACTGKDPRRGNLTEADRATLKNFCAMFGYMCHAYKNPSFSPAVILSDEGADDESRNGGRGKTLFTKAISYVQPSITKGGREFDPNYTHVFADLDKSRRLYILDDVPAGFRYDDLYTNIVGGISCQRKGEMADEIPFSEAPQFIITTNWAVRYNQEDTSTNRRFFEYKFTGFFNIENTPQQVFGQTLFEDWDNAEWDRFYNFTFNCVSLYLNDGLQRIEYDKAGDNYRAYFNNDAVLEEFESVLNIVSGKAGGFTVRDFLHEYNRYDNPNKGAKFFHHKNVKKLVDAYVNRHNPNLEYSQRDKKRQPVEVEKPRDAVELLDF